MADAEVVTSEVAQDDEPTIYDRIVTQTGIKYDPENYMSVAAYKYEICNWYQKEFPEDADFEDPEKVAEDIQELINETTTILHDNKSARVRQPLPVWQGLTDPDDSDSKPKRRRPRRTHIPSPAPAGRDRARARAERFRARACR